MEKRLIALLFLATACFAQIVRIDPNPVTTTNGNVPIGAYAQLLSVPGSSIQICADSQCSTSAVTYLDGTGQTICPTGTPLTLANQKIPSCTAFSDQQGNFGFWIAAGTYVYKITLPNGTTRGPFAFSTAGTANWLTIANPPFYDSRTYNFAPQKPGGTLTAGVPATISMLPCPLGVAGNNPKYSIYLSMGAGTAEAVTVTGGTCTSGAPFGTLRFTPAHSHSGAWIAGSASVGIAEAARVAYLAGGGTVSMPAGHLTTFAMVAAEPKVSFEGWGAEATRITPGSCSQQFFGFADTVNTVNIYYGTKFRNFTLDGSDCDGINTLVGMGIYAGSDTTTISLVNGVLWENVEFINVAEAAHMERSQDLHFNKVHGWANTRFWFTDTDGGNLNAQHTFNVYFEDFKSLAFCPENQCTVASMAAPVIEFDNCETCTIHRAYMGGFGSNPNNIGILIKGASENEVIADSTILIYGILIDVEPGPLSGAIYNPGFGTLTNNTLGQWYKNAIKIADGTNFVDAFFNVHDFQIIGNEFGGKNNTDPGDQLYLGLYAHAFTIIGNLFQYIQAGQTAIHDSAYTDSIIIANNNFHNFINFDWHLATAILLDPGSGSNTSITGNTCSGLTLLTEAPCILDNSGVQQNKIISGNLPLANTGSTGVQVLHSNITKIANGATYVQGAQAFTCATAAGCWTQPATSFSPLLPATAVNTLQDFVLAAYTPTNGPLVGPFLLNARIKTSTACTGTSTLTAQLGTPDMANSFISSYDLKAAVSHTNFAPTNGTLNSFGSGGFDIAQILITLTSTGGTLDQVANGCSLDLWLFYNILP